MLLKCSISIRIVDRMHFFTHLSVTADARFIFVAKRRISQAFMRTHIIITSINNIDLLLMIVIEIYSRKMCYLNAFDFQ